MSDWADLLIAAQNLDEILGRADTVRPQDRKEYIAAVHRLRDAIRVHTAKLV